MRHLGLVLYQPLAANFGLVPDGPLPARADTGQLWTAQGAGTVAAGVLTVAAPGVLTVSPGPVCGWLEATLGPPDPDTDDSLWLVADYQGGGSDMTYLAVNEGSPWAIVDVIAGVPHTRATAADPGTSDRDVVRLTMQGATLTASLNGVVILAATSTRARGPRVGLEFGDTLGVRQLLAGGALYCYP